MKKKTYHQGLLEGAQIMFDVCILAGVEIDGIDYLPLDRVMKRAKNLMRNLKKEK